MWGLSCLKSLVIRLFCQLEIPIVQRHIVPTGPWLLLPWGRGIFFKSRNHAGILPRPPRIRVLLPILMEPTGLPFSLISKDPCSGLSFRVSLDNRISLSPPSSTPGSEVSWRLLLGFYSITNSFEARTHRAFSWPIGRERREHRGEKYQIASPKLT